MRAIFCGFLLLLLSSRASGQNAEWLCDLGQAQVKARAENKFVLLSFAGSDWCKWCMYLKREVFDTPEFTAFAQEKLVLVDIDFPRYKIMANMQKVGNKQVARTYHVSSYPTIVMLGPDGQQLGRFGYVHGGPARFIDEVKSQTKMAKQQAQTSADPQPVPPPRKAVAFSLPPPPPPTHYGPLTLKSISGPKDRRIVLINNASLMKGETAKVRSENADRLVTCKDIRESSVLITCDGKDVELRFPEK